MGFDTDMKLMMTLIAGFALWAEVAGAAQTDIDLFYKKGIILGGERERALWTFCKTAPDAIVGKTRIGELESTRWGRPTGSHVTTTIGHRTVQLEHDPKSLNQKGIFADEVL